MVRQPFYVVQIDTLTYCSEEKKQKVLSWIFPDHVDIMQRAILETRKGSGRWLREHSTYQSWATGEATNAILWCSGIRLSLKSKLLKETNVTVLLI
jgi:hypothetical protein